jgi:hypothetical protein
MWDRTTCKVSLRFTYCWKTCVTEWFSCPLQLWKRLCSGQKDETPGVGSPVFLKGLHTDTALSHIPLRQRLTFHATAEEFSASILDEERQIDSGLYMKLDVRTNLNWTVNVHPTMDMLYWRMRSNTAALCLCSKAITKTKNTENLFMVCQWLQVLDVWKLDAW